MRAVAEAAASAAALTIKAMLNLLRALSPLVCLARRFWWLAWAASIAVHPALAQISQAPMVAPAISSVRAATPSAPAARPKVGLVLGGGGARGAAHLGVLQVLEELRIPVDCVAGTSMGALVAGAWASGLSPAQMQADLAKADWADMFQDNPEFSELNYRTKRLSQRFLAGSEAGIQAGGAVAPPGVVSGQKIKLFFNHLVRADTGEPEIENLPLPLSIIATDIGNGQRVVFRDGSLTLAMRASMSVPGLMAPLEYRGRKLVDGGLVDNVPIREVRERCGAQVVIAVNVGSPPLKPEEVTGLLSITAQMIALLTEQNVSTALALLGPGDIYIKPDLGTVSAADFDRYVEAAQRGRAAALAAAPRLQALSVSESEYSAWRLKVAVRERSAPRVDEVQVAGLLRADESLVLRHLEQRVGQPLDTQQLTRDLMRVYGDGYYERVDYTVWRNEGRNVLRVLPVEKSWGPDYLRLGVQLDTSLAAGSSYLLRAAYHRTWLNRLGGELMLTGEMGSAAGISADLYQPLVQDQRWFVQTVAEHRSDRNDYFFGETRVAQYSTVRSRLDLLVGHNFKLLGQLRGGWRETKVFNRLETGIDVFAQVPQRRDGGWWLGLDLDRLDRLYFARSGWALQASLYSSRDSGYDRLALDARYAQTVGSYVWAGRVSWVGSTRGELPLLDAGKLGGFLNLTGFANGQLVGDGVGYAHVRTERIIGRAPLGLRGDMRLGLALEVGKVSQPYALQRRNGWLGSAAVYLGGETPLGPMYVGLGQGTGRTVNAYLFIGTP
jgi:NTE family protein